MEVLMKQNNSSTILLAMIWPLSKSNSTRKNKFYPTLLLKCESL
jgi:hypothetical protein